MTCERSRTLRRATCPAFASAELRTFESKQDLRSSVAMSAVTITAINVLDNPQPVNNPLQFEIHYECLTDLEDGTLFQQLDNSFPLKHTCTCPAVAAERTCHTCNSPGCVHLSPLALRAVPFKCRQTRAHNCAFCATGLQQPAAKTGM